MFYIVFSLSPEALVPEVNQMKLDQLCTVLVGQRVEQVNSDQDIDLVLKGERYLEIASDQKDCLPNVTPSPTLEDERCRTGRM